MANAPDKMERIAARLQHRIAEITARYELDLVMLQDEIETLKDQLKGAEGDSTQEEDPEA